MNEEENYEFEPCGDRVVIQVPERKSKAGLIIPESVEMSSGDGKKAMGKIKAIGPDVQDERLKCGTMVIYNPAEALPLTINKHKYFVVYEVEIIGICSPAKAK